MRDGKVGAICDVCGRNLTPYQTIKIKALYLTDSTGSYRQLNKCDMCIYCYNDIWEKYMRGNK